MSTKVVLKRLAAFLWLFRGSLIVSFLCAAFSVLVNVAAPLFIGSIIDRISAGMDVASLLDDIGVLVLMYLLYSLLNWGMMAASNRIAFSSSSVLRRQLYAKLEQLPTAFYDQNARGDLISRFINDIDFISDGFLQSLSTMLSGIATIVLTLVFMLQIDLLMTLIVVISAPFTYLVARIITVRTNRYFNEQANVLGKLNGFSEEMLTGIRTVKAFGFEQDAQQQFEAYDQQLYGAGVKAQFYGSLANPSTRFVMNSAYALVGAIGALSAFYGSITIGNISTFLMYSNLFSKPFTEITGVMTQLQSALSSGKRIFAIMDLPVQSEDVSMPDLQIREGAVSFDHVSFSYDAKKPLMRDLSLEVPAGSKVAIVGRTGAGKTTLVNLLMRFYDVDGGCIRIDGQRIDEVKRDSLRAQFGMVLQDTYLFEGTIAENIAYGKPQADRAEIISAAKKSGAHEFIIRLNHGYDTRLHANSNILSQGQRQLLSITRVLLMNPHILILDEATSSIDTVSEQHVNQAMELLMEGKTSFIIAHRLSTIVDADQILVMEQGTVIEQGTHAELLAQNGAYTQLFNSQFAT